MKKIVVVGVIVFAIDVSFGSELTFENPADELPVIVDELRIGGFGPQLVVVPIADPKREDCIAQKTCNETITDIVRSMISSEYAISKFEITFDDYEVFVEATGREIPEDNGWGRDSRPVIFVAWKDALAYADWLTEQAGFTYRLPSVIEWEHAARAGTHTAYWWGSELGINRANCSDCASRWSHLKTATVGSFPPNPWGIYDLHGNVGEFTRDCAMQERRFSFTRRFPTKLNELSAEPKFFRKCRWVRRTGSSWISTLDPLVLQSYDRTNSFIPRRMAAYPERYKSAAMGIRVVRVL